MDNTGLNKVEALVKSVGIPPQPDLVLKILNDIDKDNIDIQGISNSISKDVSLSAKVLKVANSPFFRKGKVETIFHAVNILGIKNFRSIILIASLEEALQVNKENLRKFWRHSKMTALTCSLVAKEVKIKEDVAYMTGLFHDVGVSIMINKFNNYNSIEDFALYLISCKGLTDAYDCITGYESTVYNTNHCILAYAMSKSWGLSDDICQVILHHHAEPQILKSKSMQNLLSSLQLAEYISECLEQQRDLDKSHQTVNNALNLLSLQDSQIDAIYEEMTTYLNEPLI